MTVSSAVTPTSVAIVVAIDVYCRGVGGTQSDNLLKSIYRHFQSRAARFEDLFSDLSALQHGDRTAYFSWLHSLWLLTEPSHLSTLIRAASIYVSPAPTAAVKMANYLGKHSILGSWCLEISTYYLTNKQLADLFEKFVAARAVTLSAVGDAEYHAFAARAEGMPVLDSQLSVKDAIERELAPEDSLSELKSAIVSDDGQRSERAKRQNDIEGAIRAAHAQFSRLPEEEHPRAMLKLAEIYLRGGELDHAAEFILEAIALARRRGNNYLVVVATITLFTLSLDFPNAVTGIMGGRQSLWSFLESGQNKQVYAEHFDVRLMLKELAVRQSLFAAAPRATVMKKLQDFEEVFQAGYDGLPGPAVCYRSAHALFDFLHATTSNVDADIHMLDLIDEKGGVSSTMTMEMLVNRSLVMGIALDRTEEAIARVEAKRSFLEQDKSVAEIWSITYCILNAHKYTKQEKFGEAAAYLNQAEKLDGPYTEILLKVVLDMAKCRFLLATENSETAYQLALNAYRGELAKPTGHMAFALIYLSTAIRSLADIAQEDISAYEQAYEHLIQFEDHLKDHKQEIAETQVEIAKVLLASAAGHIDEAKKLSTDLIGRLSGTQWPRFLCEAYCNHASVLAAAYNAGMVSSMEFADTLARVRYLVTDRFQSCQFAALERQLEKASHEYG